MNSMAHPKILLLDTVNAIAFGFLAHLKIPQVHPEVHQKFTMTINHKNHPAPMGATPNICLMVTPDISWR